MNAEKNIHPGQKGVQDADMHHMIYLNLFGCICCCAGYWEFWVHTGFYAGKKDSGVVMFILTITVVGSVVSGIWALIDLIIGICNISTPQEIFENKK